MLVSPKLSTVSKRNFLQGVTRPVMSKMKGRYQCFCRVTLLRLRLLTDSDSGSDSGSDSDSGSWSGNRSEARSQDRNWNRSSIGATPNSWLLR